jgi:flagellar hook assembly protein FlgD
VLALLCHPNPFNPTTTITFSLPSAAHTRIEIYDAAGRWSRTLVDKALPEGPHQVIWDGRGRSGERLNSGVYFCHITAGDLSTSQKMVLLR